jgi:metallophosphoesterase (TIGR00282 family)
MRILFLGDIVGRPGRRMVTQMLPHLIAAERVDFVVANCENASGGKGIDPQSAEDLQDAGVDVLTSGNHVWQDPAIVAYIRENERLVRPLNFPKGVPGRGWSVRRTRKGQTPIGVLNLIGRVFMNPADCPFQAAAEVIEEMRAQTKVIVVDMHGEATSEKVGMGRFLDGRVSAVLGSHTHVQTADEAIFPGGTAYLTDAGMCGPEESILGIRCDLVLRRFLTQMPVRFEVATGPAILQGALVDVDEATGHATAIRRLQQRVEG